jgi:predicted lipoprotein with Yx(FWY)xxD motif
MICRFGVSGFTALSYHAGPPAPRRRIIALTILLHRPLNPNAKGDVITVVGSMRGASLPRRSLYGIAGAAFLVASGAIHLELYLTGYNSIPTIGWLFLLQVISAFLLAIAIPATGLLLAYAAGAAFAIATLGGYLLSLKIGLFGFTEVRTKTGIVAGIIDVAAFAVLAAGVVSGLQLSNLLGRRLTAARALQAIGAISVVALALMAAAVATPKTQPAVASGSGNMLKARQIDGKDLLTNAKGFTLYWFAPDSSGKSVCYSSCAAYWPPVAGNASAGPGVTGTIGTIRRTDGTTQATYDGHPLYTYIGDNAPGADGGNNINLNGGLWHDVPVSGA